MSAGSLTPVPDPIPSRPDHAPGASWDAVVGLLGDILLEVRGPGPSESSEVTGTRPRLGGLTISSQRVRAGDLYAAPAGARAHGASYAAAAVEAGAVAVLTDLAGAEMCADLAVPVLVVARPREVLGTVAALVYGAPATRLRLLAVTGTQGKTTTTRLAEGALTRAGVSAGVVGTVGTRIAGQDVGSSLTTPEAPDLHALFAVMLEQGVHACAMEVSSHALVMGRVDGVVFDVACFTNLGRDHLDFHRDEEDYFAAKASLFTPERARRGLVNVDDPYGRRLRDRPLIPTSTFSAAGAEADWRATDVELEPTGSRLVVHPPTGEPFEARVPLPGGFNVANALGAVAGLAELGFDPRAVAAGLAESGGVPGRLERVEGGQDFLAVVDYAHKPDAVEAALAALRPHTHGRVIAVLGAGGDRDRGKRPVMGAIAAHLADVVVVTDDNPRTEDPASIRAAVAEGCGEVHGAERAVLHVVGDRRRAIALAVSLARAGDVVAVLGKGHERGQEIDGVVHPFDDRAVLLEELSSR